VAGMHDRLVPLAEIRAALVELQSRGNAAESLGPELAALTDRAEALATAADLDGLRETVAHLAGRLDVLAGRPVLGTADVSAALAPVHQRLDELGSREADAERTTALHGRLDGLDESLGEVRGHLADVRDAVAGLPALAADLTGVAGQVAELGRLRGDVQGVQERLAVLQDGSPEVADALAALRAEVAGLADDVGGFVVPTAEQVAAAVSARVTGQLVDELAPRVAEIVLARIGPTVVEQVVGQVADRVVGGVTTPVLEGVRASAAASERRLRTHTDEAILALAEALLRRRRALRLDAPEAQEIPAAAVPLPGGTDCVAESAAAAAADVAEPGAPSEPPSAELDDPDPDGPEPDTAVPVETPAGVLDGPDPSGGHQPVPAGQQPAAATDIGPYPAPVNAAGDDHSRRRPWWRPGG
jgi:ubiquinone biosynthesis protein UbiJ